MLGLGVLVCPRVDDEHVGVWSVGNPESDCCASHVLEK